jgi:3-hydroxyacyl-CoA dehydrogenase
MGSQIAGHLANNGIKCFLLDLAPSVSAGAGDGKDGRKRPGRSQLAEAAMDRLLKLKPAPLYSNDVLKLITPGNFEDDLARIGEADWVIEAVAENPAIKAQVWSRIAPHIRPDAIASTNTSGIPIGSLAQALPADLRRRFLGTHFFNPPRYLHLLEVIPAADTDPNVVADISRFAEQVLGKGVVVARDIPNFISTRIGCYGMMAVLEAMEEFGIGPDEADSITGPAMARPRSATFRTLDLVGLDVFVDVCANVSRSVSDEAERKAFLPPQYFHQLIGRKWLGEKSGQGFYKRVQQDGKTEILALDPKSLEYRPQKRMQSAALAAVRDIEDPGERLKTVVNADDVAGRFAWRVLSRLLAYSAGKVGEVADDVASIDRAMRWGFGWELGPFETWDALGVKPTTERMRADGLNIPGWVEDLAATDGKFYRHEPAGSSQWAPRSVAVPVPEPSRTLSLERLRAIGRRVSARPGATIFDIGDGVAFLDFHSPKQAIGGDMLDAIYESLETVPGDFRGLVIGSHVRPNFSVGANLFLMVMSAQDGEWEQLEAMVRRFQYGMLGLKRASFPVVVTPFGLALGGGAEVVLAADRIVAAAESYIGLVEVGAGIIPGGGGCKEMLLRAYDGVALQYAGAGPRRGMLGQLVPEPDVNPVLAHLFEVIGLARVSGSAVEARQMGFLRPFDVIVPNLDQVLYAAKHVVCELDEQGYTPPAPQEVLVAGEGARAVLDLAAQHMVWGGFASEHDFKIARKLAHVLTGGDRPAGSRASEEYILDLEREAVMSLFGEPKTVARMQHLLETGRPLRN